MILQGLVPHLNKAKFLLNENSSTILTAVGVGGTVATAVLTGRATFKAAEVIAAETKLAETELKVIDKTEGIEDWEKKDLVIRASTLSKIETIHLIWKLYIPPVISGFMTITCIIAANKISSRKIAALTIAGGISERALQEYKEKVVEKLGVRQDQKVRDEIAQDRVNANPPKTEALVVGTGEVLCFDGLTGRYFHSSMEEIKRAENKINYELIHYNSCSLSHFYEEIGLEPTTYSDQVGWNMGDHLEVKTSAVFTTDNKPCIAIDFSRPPQLEYQKFWD